MLSCRSTDDDDEPKKNDASVTKDAIISAKVVEYISTQHRLYKSTYAYRRSGLPEMRTYIYAGHGPPGIKTKI